MGGQRRGRSQTTAESNGCSRWSGAIGSARSLSARSRPMAKMLTYNDAIIEVRGNENGGTTFVLHVKAFIRGHEATV